MSSENRNIRANENSPKKPGYIVQAFENDCILVRLDQMLPNKPWRATIKSSKKYKQIAASIQAVGLVEPPVLSRDPVNPGSYFILDGHLRIEVLKELGQVEVECLIATDDEAFTYNKQVSRLAAVQEHAMIVNALKLGVPEEYLANALSINVSSIRRRANMLKGICSEARELLEDKNCPMAVFEKLKKMQPLRQIEASELMINANNYSVAYASAILAGTPQSQLAASNRPKTIKGMTADAIIRMEKELNRLQEGMVTIRDTYAKDHLELTVVKGYLKRLLANASVVRYLAVHRPEYLREFQSIVDMESAQTPP